MNTTSLLHRGCVATLSIYPGFEQLLVDLAREVARVEEYYDLRAKLELSILDSFKRHPCRVPHTSDTRAAGIHAHFYLIPVAWRATAMHTHRSAHRSALDVSRTTALYAVLDSATFALAPENHFILSASRQDLSVWGKHVIGRLAEPRLMCVLLEQRRLGTGVAHGDRCARVVRAPLEGFTSGGLRSAAARAAHYAWDEVVRLGLTPATPSLPLAPQGLLRAVSTRGALAVSVCTASAAYAQGQKRPTTANACLSWLHTLRQSGYSGPVAIATGGPAPRALAAAAKADGWRGGAGARGGGGRRVSGGQGGGVWLIDFLETRCPRRPWLGSEASADEGGGGDAVSDPRGAGSVQPGSVQQGSTQQQQALGTPLRGNQLRLLWYSALFGEVAAVAPNASVLAVDARDVLFQSDPFTAMQATRPRGCILTFAADCACAAVADSYFMRWQVWLPPEPTAPIGSAPCACHVHLLFGCVRPEPLLPALAGLPPKGQHRRHRAEAACERRHCIRWCGRDADALREGGHTGGDSS